MAVELVLAYDALQDVHALFTEYTDTLIQSESAVREFLNTQHYDQELQDLQLKYGPPDGQLYWAHVDGKNAGCIGLRWIMQIPVRRSAYMSAPLFEDNTSDIS